MIELSRIHMRHSEKEILKDINLEIAKGEIFTIIGPTGAGKTTLLRLINLLEIPSSGTIFFDGQNVNISKSKRLHMRRRMAMLFQKPVMFNARVYDNVAYGLKFRGYEKRSVEKKVNHALEMVDLSDYKEQNAKTLSGGEAQRVALARAIAIGPELILLDEPTANLDPISKDRIEKLILRINHEHGTTVVMATHDMIQGQRLANRIGIMLNGEIRQVGPPKEIFNCPKNEEVAEFVGAENILSGRILSNDDGIALIDLSGHKVQVVTNIMRGDVDVFIRPEDVILSKNLINSSARNVIESHVQEIDHMGPLVRIKMENGIAALITRQSQEEMEIKQGCVVYASFKASVPHVVSANRTDPAKGRNYSDEDDYLDKKTGLSETHPYDEDSHG
jgi:tungstate transport system ATP-binding protein